MTTSRFAQRTVTQLALATVLCSFGCSSESGADTVRNSDPTSNDADGGTSGNDARSDAEIAPPAEGGSNDGSLGSDANESAPPSEDGGAPPGPATATLRTYFTLQYVTVASDGSSVAAGSDTAGAAETFTLTDLNGGSLEDGDSVLFAANNGQYLSAVDGGGGMLRADAPGAGDDETFVVTRIDGPGAVSSGDRIALGTKAKDNYVSAIDGGGGEVRADAPWAREWEMFRIYLNGDSPPSASAGRQKVLDYIASIAGSKTISGQHNKFNDDPSGATKWIEDHTGKVPGLWSADFGFGDGAANNRDKMIKEATKQWSQGSIVQILYHTCIPTRDELCGWDDIGGANPQHLSDAEWNELVTDGTALNTAWKQRLDALSVFFAKLETAGVAPLFRPLHEMNQGVFWWGGRGGANGTRRLFQLTHDYLVKTKGFEHIIWMWDVQDFGSLQNDVSAYDPGQDYYDIAALDIYGGGYDAWKYDAIRGAAGSRPFGIGECAVVPTSERIAEQPAWAFFMLWPDFLQENEDAGRLLPLYNAPNVITRDQMPGWE